MKRILAFVLVLALALPVLAQSVDEYKFSLVPRRPTTLPANSAGYLLNDGSGGLSWGALDLSPYVKKDGSTELTADWNVGAFDLTCVDMNATRVLVGSGSLAAPAIAFTADSDTGLSYKSVYAASSDIEFIVDGIFRGYIASFGLVLNTAGALYFDTTLSKSIIQTLGNFTWTTSLTAASGDEVGFLLSPTINKAAGNYTAFKINATEISAPGTGDLLLDLRVADSSKFNVSNSGHTHVLGNLYLDGLTLGFGSGGKSNSAIYSGSATATSGDALAYVPAAGDEFTNTSGARAMFSIQSRYNQASGTASNTDLLINRAVQTAVGSGTQRLISAQVGSTERVGFDNKGFEVRSYPLTPTHDTASPLFGITVAAGSTAGGVITYTLNVTDDDGSDDQIEVGTVQFVGLQDEANWHTNISEVSTQAVESGTLATTWAIDTATANTLKVTLQATSNLTSPVYTLSYTVTFNNSYTVTTY